MVQLLCQLLGNDDSSDELSLSLVIRGMKRLINKEVTQNAEEYVMVTFYLVCHTHLR